ncbi:MAG: hypothetical protein QOK36_1263 [Gaiellales bacterium]|jgi:hypothetical protein|nr:hypothetical protein [Gaiellales bacterium]
MPVLSEAERHALAMRLVCDYEARRFHVEFTTAELRGGGAIAGRVHRDREFAAGPIIVRARCMEAWREAPPRVPILPATRSMRLPRWHERTLWSQEIVLDGLAEAHWAPFGFELPAGLPPAVEARAVAWRYEVEARRPLRLRPDERAIAVPLGFRAMLLEPGLPVPLRLA